MMKVTEIILELKDLGQLFIAPDTQFYGKRILSAGAEEYIIEEATMASSRGDIHLKLRLSRNAAGREHEVISSIHQHFAHRKVKSKIQLKKVLQLGWRSLLIAIVFLAFLVALVLVIIRLLPEGGLSVTFREILIILGWVALWRPADLLLYEWRPLKREVNLFSRLEQCKVEIIVTKV